VDSEAVSAAAALAGACGAALLVGGLSTPTTAPPPLPLPLLLAAALPGGEGSAGSLLSLASAALTAEEEGGPPAGAALRAVGAAALPPLLVAGAGAPHGEEVGALLNATARSTTSAAREVGALLNETAARSTTSAAPPRRSDANTSAVDGGGAPLYRGAPDGAASHSGTPRKIFPPMPSTAALVAAVRCAGAGGGAPTPARPPAPPPATPFYVAPLGGADGVRLAAEAAATARTAALRAALLASGGRPFLPPPPLTPAAGGGAGVPVPLFSPAPRLGGGAAPLSRAQAQLALLGSAVDSTGAAAGALAASFSGALPLRGGEGAVALRDLGARADALARSSTRLVANLPPPQLGAAGAR
jgi:hypothetical protein